MSETTAGLRRKIAGANDLQSVVRSMKAMASTSVGQYETSVKALSEYFHTVELGLGALFRKSDPFPVWHERTPERISSEFGVIVFGSDQGLVGRFNDEIINYAIRDLKRLPKKPKIWAVGDRVNARLTDSEFSVEGVFDLPSSVRAISPLIGRILIQAVGAKVGGENELHLYYNRPTSGATFAPHGQRLLPLDRKWMSEVSQIPWPTKMIPEIVGDETRTLEALFRGYLFISLFRGCAESLAAENASRLAAMQRAERNIEDQLDELTGKFNRMLQSRIDEELFDVVSGFEALTPKKG